jgi:hypothetical protein
MTFEARLREQKNNIKKSSQDTYLRNIRRLRKVNGKLPIPEKSNWLTTDKLFEWYNTQPLNVRRHMSTAAVVALGVYKNNNPKWKKLQRGSMKEFDEERASRQLSKKQKNLIPKGGFDRIKKVITALKRELTHIKSIDNLKQLIRFQDLMILSLYYEYPLRLDYATLHVGKVGSNRIYKNTKKPKGWHIELRDYKTQKSEGDKVFKLNLANQRLLNKFIPAVQKLTTHGFLLSNSRGGKMSKQVLSKRLMGITSKRIGKKFSVQLLRILYAMRNRDVIESAKEVSDKLLHSQKQSLQYAKKDS